MCSNDPYIGNYKDGYFEHIITDSVSLLSCLQILLNFAELSTREKDVFQEITCELESKLALEASGRRFSEDEMLPFKSFVLRIQTLRDDDKKARIERQKLHPSQPSKDAVMDDQQTCIPDSMSRAVRIIHESIVGACSQHSSFKFKDGRFASDVLISHPIMSCLKSLIDSSYINSDEKAVFAAIVERLIALVAREANGEPISLTEAEHVAIDSFTQLEKVFRNDKRERFLKEPKHPVIP